MSQLQETVARSADVAGLHAPVPTLLLELQTVLGALAGSVTAATDRGRRPFRASPELAARLGELAYGVYLLADQCGVDITAAVEVTAQQLTAHGEQAQAEDDGWPFGAAQ